MADDQPLPRSSTATPVQTPPDVGSQSRGAPRGPPVGAPVPRPSAPQSAPAAPEEGAQAEPPPNPAEEKKRKRTRGRLFAILGVVVLVGAVGYGVYYVLVASKVAATDDAYVGADVAQVTPQISGTVTDVRVRDTEAVRRGDVLAVIDSADTRLAAAQAVADYGRAQRRVRQYFATNVSAGAATAARQAELARAAAQLTAAQADVEKARVDLQRRQALVGSGAVSGEELTSAKTSLQNALANVEADRASGRLAQANVEAARAQEKSQLALTAGSDLEANPEVAAAKAALDTARLNMERTVLRAPLDGTIARRQVQVGQRVSVGQQLMTIVPMEDVYVDANFKEVQLRKVRVGQPVTLTADKYGGGVVYHGRVEGFSGGTGSAFAVIPAQNATGNWIKVVQRLPVRIRLDRDEVSRHPLQVGLSMKASIDVGGGSGTPPQASGGRS